LGRHLIALVGHIITMHHHHPVDAPGHQADHNNASADLPLAPGENVLASLTVDLDAELRFAGNPLVLTDRS
jgi:ATP-binding cassette subfamily B protein